VLIDASVDVTDARKAPDLGTRSSASSSLYLGVQLFEFSAGIVDLELPVDAPLLRVRFRRK